MNHNSKVEGEGGCFDLKATPAKYCYSVIQGKTPFQAGEKSENVFARRCGNYGGCFYIMFSILDNVDNLHLTYTNSNVQT